MKKNSILFLTLLVSGFYFTQAQPAPHEFSVFLNGGFAANCFQPMSKNVSSAGYGGDLGVGFTGFVSQQLGFQTGVGLGFSMVKSKAGELQTITPGLLDNQNKELYDLHTTLNGYAELHKTLFFSIPAMFQFQTKMRQSWDWTRSQKNGFYVATGVKVHLLISNRYESNIATLSNRAYYIERANWAATQEFAGFGLFKRENGNSGKLDFAVMALFTLETGMKWRLGKGSYLYTGVYFDCGLNDPTKKERKEYGTYTAPEQLKEMTLMKISDKLNYMAAGIKVRVAFTRNTQ